MTYKDLISIDSVAVIPLYRNNSTYLQCQSLDWLLCDEPWPRSVNNPNVLSAGFEIGLLAMKNK